MKPISFFDDEAGKGQKKIWSKATKGQETLEKIVGGLELKSVFLKKTKKNGKSKIRLLAGDINGNLYMCKNEKTEKIAGVLEMACVRVDLLQGVEPKPIDASCNELLNGFRLARNGKSTEFFTRDPVIFKRWKNYVSLRGIQASFHEEFLVTKMIGKGSFAKVYLATRRENGLQYAIKAFNKEFMASQHKGKESLVNEVAVMRALHHETLINLYEVYETTNSIYFVLDLLSGGELLHRVRDKGTLQEQELKPLLRHLIQALHHLHLKNIMHRDLKPENLLLRSKNNDHEIVVADFGLATFTHTKDILFKRCGTPGFVAPEVLSYKEGDPLYDVKCDIFSAGIIFYLLLIGKQPFSGKDYKQILRANKACEISYDTPDFSGVSATAKDLLKRMLDPKPTSRISAAESLNHPFISNSDNQSQANERLTASQNLRTYDVEFLANVRQKNQGEDMVGSLALNSGGSPALNGLVDTVGSLSACSNSTLSKGSPQIPPLSSKFSKPRAESIDANALRAAQLDPGSPSNSQESTSPTKTYKNSQSKNLHKLAIQNSLYRGYQEERKDQKEYYEDSCDVSEENSPLSDSLHKMNFEKQMKHTPSKAEEQDMIEQLSLLTANSGNRFQKK